MDRIAWRDPAQPWQVKLSRAADHVAHLRESVRVYGESDPHEIVHEPTSEPHLTRVRVVLRRQPPPEMSAVIGDAVHNLRSALDSVAYAIVVADHDGEWDPANDSRPEFPITENPDEFATFLRKSRHSLVADRATAALRAGQPWFLREQFEHESVDEEEEWRYDSLRQLRHLSNVDKHRRLAFTAWQQTDLVWWGSSGDESTTRQVLARRLGDPPDVLGYEYDPPGGPPADPTVREFSLGLSEDGIPRSDSVHGQLVAWCRDVEWVIGRVAFAWDRYKLNEAASTAPT